MSGAVAKGSGGGFGIVPVAKGDISTLGNDFAGLTRQGIDACSFSTRMVTPVMALPIESGLVAATSGDRQVRRAVASVWPYIRKISVSGSAAFEISNENWGKMSTCLLHVTKTRELHTGKARLTQQNLKMTRNSGKSGAVGFGHALEDLSGYIKRESVTRLPPTRKCVCKRDAPKQ